MTDTRATEGHEGHGHHHGHGAHAGHHHHEPAADAGKVKDPVCGMMVDPHTTQHRAQYEGKPYYFCSAGCQSKFMAEPAKYVEPAAERKAEPVPEGTIYTCPMHPQIRQVGPGSCPICGMALEPVLATAETGPSHELVDMTRRFWIGLVLSAAGGRAGDGRPSDGPEPLRRPADLELDPDASGDAGRALGGLAVLRARLAVARHPQPEHVHADRHGHGRGLGLQRGRDARPGRLPGGLPRP